MMERGNSDKTERGKLARDELESGENHNKIERGKDRDKIKGYQDQDKIESEKISA